MYAVSQQTKSKRSWIICFNWCFLQWIHKTNNCQLYPLSCEFIGQKFSYLSGWFQMPSDVCTSNRNTWLPFKMWHFLPHENPLKIYSSSTPILDAPYLQLSRPTQEKEDESWGYHAWLGFPKFGVKISNSTGVTYWASPTSGFRRAYVADIGFQSCRIKKSDTRRWSRDIVTCPS